MKKEVKRATVTSPGGYCANVTLPPLILCGGTHCGRCNWYVGDQTDGPLELGDTLILYDDGSVELQKASN